MTRRARAAALALMVGVLSSATPVAAQDWLNPDVIALREEVARLSLLVEQMRGGGAGGAGGGATGGGVAVDQMAGELRQLRGAIERIEFQQRRLAQQQAAVIEALRFRLETLEDINGVTPPEQPELGQFTDLGAGAAAAGGAGIGAGGGAAAGGGVGAGGGLTALPSDQDGVLGTFEGQGPGFEPLVDQPQFEGGGGAAATGARPATADPALYESALDNLRAGAFDQAEREFIAFIDGNPGDPRVGEATFWLGETYFVRGMWQEAARAFLAGWRDYPDGPKAPDSLLKLGMTLAQLGQRAEACQTFAQVPVRYPDAASSVLRRARVEAQRAGCV